MGKLDKSYRAYLGYTFIPLPRFIGAIDSLVKKLRFQATHRCCTDCNTGRNEPRFKVSFVEPLESQDYRFSSLIYRRIL